MEASLASFRKRLRCSGTSGAKWAEMAVGDTESEDAQKAKNL